MVKPIPEGYHSITPSLVYKDAKAAIAFYKKAFGAQELSVFAGPDGKIMHAELKIGNSIFMLGEESPSCPDAKSAETTGAAASFSLNLYVPDADATFRTAVAAGAKAAQTPQEMFWGDRFGRAIDPFGYGWNVMTHIKDVSTAEKEKGAKEFMGKALAGKK